MAKKTPAKAPAHTTASKVAQRFQARPAPQPEAEGNEFQEFPKIFYKKVPTSPRYPNGYMPRRVYDEVEQSELDPKVWKASPDEL